MGAPSSTDTSDSQGRRRIFRSVTGSGGSGDVGRGARRSAWLQRWGGTGGVVRTVVYQLVCPLPRIEFGPSAIWVSQFFQEILIRI